VKNDFGRFGAEAKFAAGSGVNLFAGRGYWNIHKINPVTLFAGAEGGYIKFNTLATKGTGWEASVFAGGKMPLSHWLSISMDFAPMFIKLNSQSTGVNGMEYVVNFAIYIHPFKAKPSRPTSQNSSRESGFSFPEARAVAPTATVSAPAPNPAASIPALDVGAADKIGSLIKALKSDDDSARAKAAVELGKLGNSLAVSPLIEALQDESIRVRGTASDALGKIGDPRAVEPLIALLHDSEPKVRALAARALGLLGDSRAQTPLLQLAEDGDPIVREKAGEAIKRLRQPNAALDDLLR
jgi:hypothetical protein